MRSNIKLSETKKYHLLSLFEESLELIERMLLDGQNDVTLGEKAQIEREAQDFLDKHRGE